MAKVKVFFSYSRKDYDILIPLFIDFKALLKTVSHQGKKYQVEYYWDERTTPGQEWDETIKWKLASADVILFFVTNNFLYSGYILSYEIPLALDRKENSKIHLLPVLVEQCEFHESPIKHLQFIPNYKGYLKPLLEWSNKKAFREYIRFALKICIKNSLDGHPQALFFNSKSLSPTERKKHIELFAPPEINRLAKVKTRKKQPKKKKTIVGEIKKAVKKVLRW